MNYSSTHQDATQKVFITSDTMALTLAVSGESIANHHTYTQDGSPKDVWMIGNEALSPRMVIDMLNHKYIEVDRGASSKQVTVYRVTKTGHQYLSRGMPRVASLVKAIENQSHTGNRMRNYTGNKMTKSDTQSGAQKNGQASPDELKVLQNSWGVIVHTLPTPGTAERWAVGDTVFPNNVGQQLLQHKFIQPYDQNRYHVSYQLSELGHTVAHGTSVQTINGTSTGKTFDKTFEKALPQLDANNPKDVQIAARCGKIIDGLSAQAISAYDYLDTFHLIHTEDVGKPTTSKLGVEELLRKEVIFKSASGYKLAPDFQRYESSPYIDTRSKAMSSKTGKNLSQKIASNVSAKVAAAGGQRASIIAELRGYASESQSLAGKLEQAQTSMMDEIKQGNASGFIRVTEKLTALAGSSKLTYNNRRNIIGSVATLYGVPAVNLPTPTSGGIDTIVTACEWDEYVQQVHDMAVVNWAKGLTKILSDLKYYNQALDAMKRVGAAVQEIISESQNYGNKSADAWRSADDTGNFMYTHKDDQFASDDVAKSFAQDFPQSQKAVSAGNPLGRAITISETLGNRAMQISYAQVQRGMANLATALHSASESLTGDAKSGILEAAQTAEKYSKGRANPSEISQLRDRIGSISQQVDKQLKKQAKQGKSINTSRKDVTPSGGTNASGNAGVDVINNGIPLDTAKSSPVVTSLVKALENGGGRVASKKQTAAGIARQNARRPLPAAQHTFNQGDRVELCDLPNRKWNGNTGIIEKVITPRTFNVKLDNPALQMVLGMVFGEQNLLPAQQKSIARKTTDPIIHGNAFTALRKWGAMAQQIQPSLEAAYNQLVTAYKSQNNRAFELGLQKMYNLSDKYWNTLQGYRDLTDYLAKLYDATPATVPYNNMTNKLSSVADFHNQAKDLGFYWNDAADDKGTFSDHLWQELETLKRNVNEMKAVPNQVESIMQKFS